MIQNVGYTDDGKIFMTILIEQEGKKGQMIMELSCERALEVSRNLALAVERYKNQVVEVGNVGNRQNLN